MERKEMRWMRWMDEWEKKENKKVRGKTEKQNKQFFFNKGRTTEDLASGYDGMGLSVWVCPSPDKKTRLRPKGGPNTGGGGGLYDG